MHLAQDTDRWWDLVNMVMYLWAPYMGALRSMGPD
jgi:hypothetical protein